MTMKIYRRLVCPRCNGSKRDRGDECGACHGDGKVTAPHHLRGEAEQERAALSPELRDAASRQNESNSLSK